MDEYAEATARSGDGLRRYVDARSRWFLLDGSRRIVAGIILLGAGSVFVRCFGAFGPVSDTLPVFYALSGLIAGNLALIPIVIAIDQLVLSREPVTPGERLETIEDVSAFRDRVAETTDEDVLSIRAPRFLDVVLTSTLEEARRIDTDAARASSSPRTSAP